PSRIFPWMVPKAPAARTRHTVRSRPLRRWHLVRLALPRADRGVHLEHQPVLWLGRLEHGRRRSRSLDHFDRAGSLRCKRGLDVLDHGFKLLVRQVLDRIAPLHPVLPPDHPTTTL